MQPIQWRSGVDMSRPSAIATGTLGELVPNLYRVAGREDMASYRRCRSSPLHTKIGDMVDRLR
jgi:hypothetical protein